MKRVPRATRARPERRWHISNSYANDLTNAINIALVKSEPRNVTGKLRIFITTRASLVAQVFVAILEDRARRRNA